MSEEKAIVGVIPGGFTYEAGIMDLGHWVSEREKRREHLGIGLLQLGGDAHI